MAVKWKRLELYQVRLAETYCLFSVNILILMYGLVTNIFHSIHFINTCSDVSQELQYLKGQLLAGVEANVTLQNLWVASSCHGVANYSQMQTLTRGRSSFWIPMLMGDKLAHLAVFVALLLLYIYLTILFVQECGKPKARRQIQDPDDLARLLVEDTSYQPDVVVKAHLI